MLIYLSDDVRATIAEIVGWDRRETIEAMEGWPADSEHNVFHAARLAAIDAALAALAEPSPMPQPLDFPDSPGWWAFRGNSNGSNEGTVIEVVEYTDCLDKDECPQPAFRINGDSAWWSFTFDDGRPSWDGKFYRMVWPWERKPQAQQAQE